MDAFTTVGVTDWVKECENVDGRIIDVRTDEEFSESFIKGAEQVNIMTPSFKDDIGKYDRDGSYFVYCRSGKRSESAMNIMKEMGFTNVYNLGGGIMDWERQGMEVEYGEDF